MSWIIRFCKRPSWSKCPSHFTLERYRTLLVHQKREYSLPSDPIFNKIKKVSKSIFLFYETFFENQMIKSKAGWFPALKLLAKYNPAKIC